MLIQFNFKNYKSFRDEASRGYFGLVCSKDDRVFRQSSDGW